MRVSLLHFVRFVATIGSGVKEAFTIPECETCKVREKNFTVYQDMMVAHILQLQEQLRVEKKEKETIQNMLFRAVRLENQVKVDSTVPQAIHGVVSPMRQRMTAESEARKKYWEKKAEQAYSLPEAVTTNTETKNA